MKIWFVLLTVMVICAFTCPVTAQTEMRSGPEARQEAPVALKIVDILFVRPVCLVGSMASTVTYLAISPLAYVLGIATPAARTMVEGPWRFTSYRYIGQFNHYVDEQPVTGAWNLNP
jgi:hypothetical protein